MLTSSSSLLSAAVAATARLYIFRSHGYSFFEGIPGPTILRRTDARECAIRCASYDLPHRAAPLPPPPAATDTPQPHDATRTDLSRPRLPRVRECRDSD